MSKVLGLFLMMDAAFVFYRVLAGGDFWLASTVVPICLATWVGGAMLIEGKS